MIKNRLVDIRLRMGYQFQKDFAEFLGVNKTQYNRWEKNVMQPDPDKMFLICEKLGKKIEDVFYRVPE